MITKIDKTKSWTQPVRLMLPIGPNVPIWENLQVANIATPLWRTRQDDQFSYFIFPNRTSDVKDMNFGSFQIPKLFSPS
jgi:hypothetical protein